LAGNREKFETWYYDFHKKVAKLSEAPELKQIYPHFCRLSRFCLNHSQFVRKELPINYF